jgi:chloramphenicol-sensitive protein RarD
MPPVAELARLTRSNAGGRGYAAAAVAGVTANVIFGASSLFWKALGEIPPTTLLGYRILMSLVTLSLAMLALGMFAGVATKLSPRVLGIHALAALLVVVNWGTFIQASIHGHVIESGLGYMVAPFVAIGVGAVFLKDRMSGVRLFALGLIVAAVVALLTGSGELDHSVYLAIGATWGGYACLKKLTPLDPFAGLLVETLVLTGVWAILLLVSPFTLALPAGLPALSIGLLAACGAVSVVPLWLFARAASRLPLSVMGFFQFVLPTTQLVVALVFYQQRMSTNTVVAFIVVWIALSIIVVEGLRGR